MVEQIVQSTLESLAERHIPKGKHNLLHVDSRKMWVSIMLQLLETGVISKKLSVLNKCAMSWELLLIQRISIQN